ncbi:MAG: hypothetical protein GXC70_06295 [Sphingomonadaceae bacterium]|nr:hypothetical protein [Sphingomonadaceae bacterium]
MGLFKADLYRSFAIGFVVGTALLAGAMAVRSGEGLTGQVIPAATAAPVQMDQTLVDPATR